MMIVTGLGFGLETLNLEVCFFIYIFPSSSVNFPYSVLQGLPVVGSPAQYKSLSPRMATSYRQHW